MIHRLKFAEGPRERLLSGETDATIRFGHENGFRPGEMVVVNNLDGIAQEEARIVQTVGGPLEFVVNVIDAMDWNYHTTDPEEAAETLDGYYDHPITVETTVEAPRLDV